MADAKLLSDALDDLWNFCCDSAKEYSLKAMARLALVSRWYEDAPYSDQVSDLDKWAVSELNEMLPAGEDRFRALLESSKDKKSDKAVRYAFALLAVRQQCRRWFALYGANNVIQFSVKAR